MDQPDTSLARPVTLSRILVPLDGSAQAAQALPFAAAIVGGRDGAEIVLLEVTPPAQNVRNVLGEEIAPAARVQEGWVQVATGRLAAAAATLPAGVTSRTVVATGDPAAEILRVAAVEGVDLIALTASGGDAWGPSAFGRVTDRVVRAAAVPVLVAPPRAGAGGGASGASGAFGGPSNVTGILVPIDGSAAAFGALPVAAALAGALGAEVRVVQAVAYRPEADPPTPSPSPPSPSPPSSSPSSSGEIAHPDTIEREFRGAPRAAAEAAVADALARLKALGVSARGEILTGNPVAAVISEAGRADLVVLTSRGAGHGEAGASDPPVSWTLGGVADKLLRAETVAMVLVPAGV